MKAPIRTALIAFGAAALFPAAFAQGPTPPTPEERAARFAKADVNKDGKLDKKEWSDALPPQMKAAVTEDMLGEIWTTRIDTNGDGFASKDEYMAVRMPGRTQ